MNKSTHSKIKNTGIMFELLTRQITADTMTGKENSPALSIIKEFFGAKTLLAKELVLYQTLLNESFKTESKAEMLLSTTTKIRKQLDEKQLKHAKYDLIKEIKKHYNLQDFFKSTVGNYKVYASIYRVFEGSGLTQIADVIRSKELITEHIVNRRSANKQGESSTYMQETEDIRLLAYKLMLEKFNTKYNDLTSPQKNILKEFINNISNTTGLRDFVITESDSLQRSLTKKYALINDQVTSIKLKEVIGLLDKNKKINRVNENHVHSLLLYHELLKEI
jgi:hypothetical protein